MLERGEVHRVERFGQGDLVTLGEPRLPLAYLPRPPTIPIGPDRNTSATHVSRTAQLCYAGATFSCRRRCIGE
jgi:hypothetical protein